VPKLPKRGIHFAALAHIVGWVKRDIGIIYVGFAYLNALQKFEIATKLANPTRLVIYRRLNPTYDLAFRPTKWIPPFSNCGTFFALIIGHAYKNQKQKILDRGSTLGIDRCGGCTAADIHLYNHREYQSSEKKEHPIIIGKRGRLNQVF
jgi:hypothetical protein